VTLDSRGATRMGDTTRQNLGRQMAVVFVENRSDLRTENGQTVRVRRTVEEVVSIATIQGIFSKRFQITGLAPQEARDLALLLRSGALAAPVDIIEERTVGPSLGQQNIEQGWDAALLGFFLVVLVVGVYYKVFGLIADLALLFNVIILVALMSILQATLTLPGIAGIVLTVGMAVDANVLIFERIREELRNGSTPQAAIYSGYEKGFFYHRRLQHHHHHRRRAVVRAGIGSGARLCGHADPGHSGVHVHRHHRNAGLGQPDLWQPSRHPSVHLGARCMELFPPNSKIDFMGQRYVWFAISGLLILLSVVGLAVRGINFGIDFTGGLVLEVRYPEAANLETVREQLAAGGFDDAQAQRFGADRDVLVRLPPQAGVEAKQLGDRVLAVLATHDPGVQLLRVEYVGPQVGEELANQGGLALLIAIAGILLYVGLRFEFRLASGAIIALVHDVIITIGVISWTQVSFDLSVLAAVLGIIGYSINDSIVIFDRIRENFIKLRRLTPIEVINSSVNQTLSRTIMTNLTVFLVLMALLILGGDTLRPFSIAMVVGSIIGTYSTIYVASSLALQMGVRREHLLPMVREGPKDQL